jgi:hypothetical protein
MVTLNFLFHLSHSGVRKYEGGIYLVIDVSHARRLKTASSPKIVIKNALIVSKIKRLID